MHCRSVSCLPVCLNTGTRQYTKIVWGMKKCLPMEGQDDPERRGLTRIRENSGSLELCVLDMLDGTVLVDEKTSADYPDVI